MNTNKKRTHAVSLKMHPKMGILARLFWTRGANQEPALDAGMNFVSSRLQHENARKSWNLRHILSPNCSLLTLEAKDLIKNGVSMP